jgi:hypothetical protein
MFWPQMSKARGESKPQMLGPRVGRRLRAGADDGVDDAVLDPEFGVLPHLPQRQLDHGLRSSWPPAPSDNEPARRIEVEHFAVTDGCAVPARSAADGETVSDARREIVG